MRHRSDTMINYGMPTLTEKESCYSSSKENQGYRSRRSRKEVKNTTTVGKKVDLNFLLPVLMLPKSLGFSSLTLSVLLLSCCDVTAVCLLVTSCWQTVSLQKISIGFQLRLQWDCEVGTRLSGLFKYGHRLKL